MCLFSTTSISLVKFPLYFYLFFPSTYLLLKHFLRQYSPSSLSYSVVLNPPVRHPLPMTSSHSSVFEAEATKLVTHN